MGILKHLYQIVISYSENIQLRKSSKSILKDSIYCNLNCLNAEAKQNLIFHFSHRL